MQNPRTALRWLRAFRFGLACLTAIAIFLQWSAGVGPSVVGTVALYVGIFLADQLERRWVARFEHQQWIVDVHAALDLAFWAAAMVLKRAADHPSLDTLLLFVVPAGLALSAGRAWIAAGAVMGVHNVIVLWGPRMHGDDGFPPAVALVRVVEQLLIFDTAVLALTGFLVGMRRLLHEREDLLQRSLDERSRDDRLVALGTMAAGIAHELGTPLSSIDLLADEAQALPHEAPELLTTLRGQVRRCREILDRIRGSTHRTVSPEVEGFGPHLRQWLADWQRAGTNRGDLGIDLAAETDTAGVQGDPDTWRGIVWSLLDNALRAGAPIRVHAHVEAGFVVLEIDDDGPGPSADVVARAGEPFFSQWVDGSQPGRGLGLFVASSFARRWGGSLRLSRRAAGGGRVTLHLATLLARYE